MYRPEKRVFRDDAFISVTRTLIESHFKVAGVELKSFPDDLHTKSMFFFGIKTAYIMQHTQHALVKTKYLSNKNLFRSKKAVSLHSQNIAEWSSGSSLGS